MSDNDDKPKAVKRQKKSGDHCITDQEEGGGGKFVAGGIPDDALITMTSFLDFGGLLLMRATSKKLKHAANEILLKRAMEVYPNLQPLNYFAYHRNVKVHLEQGWTEEFQTKDGVIAYALGKGKLSYHLGRRNMDVQAAILQQNGHSGSYSFDEDGYLEWYREVEFVENLDLKSAAEKLGTSFQKIEQNHDLKWYTYDRLEAEVNASERDAEAGQICSIKQACFSLLYSNNAARSISLSRAVWKEATFPSHDELEGSVLVFRLANNREICVEEVMENFNDFGDY